MQNLSTQKGKVIFLSSVSHYYAFFGNCLINKLKFKVHINLIQKSSQYRVVGNATSCFITIIIIIIFFYLFLISCSHSLFKDKYKTNKMGELTQNAIFQYLEQATFINILSGKGLTKIDPLLRTRDTTIFMGKVVFDDPMRSDELKYPIPPKLYQLVIPDSFAKKFRYTGFEKDYGFDYAIIHQFSPLLPTLESNIFLIEHYLWANMCEEKDCIRGVQRKYLKCIIENHKVSFLEEINTSNENEYYGYGPIPISRQELDKE